jgi:DNA modification methylase
MTVFVDDPDFVLHVGDTLDVLAGLPAESAHCVVTSPPYWGLRDYGTGTWDGGNEQCDHKADIGASASSGLNGSLAHKSGEVFTPYRDVCGKCGARRTDHQLGLEPTPDQYVANMVAVFRQVRRVLRADGTCWLNIGDSYATMRNDHEGGGFSVAGTRTGTAPKRGWHGGPDLKPKDLCGIPWRLAFALQADGWYLRSGIIWSKPNPMPESVTDRPTKAHEYLFLLTKAPRYFYDADAIREPATYFGPNGSPATMDGANNSRPGEMRSRAGRKRPLVPEQTKAGVGRQGLDSQTFGEPSELGRNRRSVWEIATAPYPDAHFATFPQALVEPCVKAGCPAGGTVLDPFMGSGTTALVARRLGRKSIGIELSPEDATLAATRLQQLSLFAQLDIFGQETPLEEVPAPGADEPNLEPGTYDPATIDIPY